MIIDPLIPMVRHTVKSLSWVGLLAVSTLHDLIKSVGYLAYLVALKPGVFDHPSTVRGRRLLILPGKVVLSDGLTDAGECLTGFSLRMQDVIHQPGKPA